MLNHGEVIEIINNYMEYHHVTKEQFCRVANIQPYILENIFNENPYISVFDYANLSKLLGLNFNDLITMC